MSTYDKVTRLLGLVFGEDNQHGDYDIVTNVISGYAEPGYSTDPETVVVLGNWNPKRWRRGDEAPLTLAENLGPRLAEALERLGAEIEWLDEWTECSGCFRAVRTTENSYSWKPSYVWTDDGPICADCAIADGEDALTDYINDASKCVTWCEPSHVESLGFELWESGDPHEYASGWFEGQDDNPDAILAAILERNPDAEVVFFLSESSQFYIKFAAYVRSTEEEI